MNATADIPSRSRHRRRDGAENLARGHMFLGGRISVGRTRGDITKNLEKPACHDFTGAPGARREIFAHSKQARAKTGPLADDPRPTWAHRILGH